MKCKLIPVFKKISGEIKYGYDDENGKNIIPYIYEYAYPFSFGLGAVRNTGNHLVGFIDANNNVIIDFEFEYVHPFNSDVTWVLKDGLWLEIDRYGNTIIKPKYLKSCGYKNGFSVVQNANSKWGVVDKYDNIILPFEYDWIYSKDNIKFRVYSLEKYIDLNLNENNKVYILHK